MNPEMRRLVGLLMIGLSIVAGFFRWAGLFGNPGVVDGAFFALLLCAWVGVMLWISGIPARRS